MPSDDHGAAGGRDAGGRPRRPASGAGARAAGAPAPAPRPEGIGRNGHAARGDGGTDHASGMGPLASVAPATGAGDAFWAQGSATDLANDPCAVLDAAEDHAIFSVDTQGRVLSWNRGAELLTGHRAADVLGTDFAILWTPEDVANRRPYRELEEAATRGHVEIDNWIRRRDGSRFWATGSCRPVRDAEGRVAGFAKVLRDTTARREAMLRQQQDHERLKQFQSQVVHELRNPLSPMLVQVRLLAQKAGADERMARSVAILDRNLWRIKRLCDDLADAAHLQLGTFPIERQPTDLARIARETAEALGPEALEAGVALVLEAPEPLPVHADPHRIAQVVHNLVVNAVRATPEGGQVTVRARRHGPGRVRVEVTDTGLGMSPQTIAQLFQPFTRVTAGGSAGMGLGLYLSKAIVRGHDGEVWAESRGAGQGSTFVVELPAPEAPDVRMPEARPAPAPPGAPLRPAVSPQPGPHASGTAPQGAGG